MATTEIFTCVHPLSLPDALPILVSPRNPSVPKNLRMPPLLPNRRVNTGTAPGVFGTALGYRIFLCKLTGGIGGGGIWKRGMILLSRSEEHTSELQSLMRISYAVFCLKKKRGNKQEWSYGTT